MNDHLAKPVNFEQLSAVIDCWQAAAPEASSATRRPQQPGAAGRDKFVARRRHSRDRLVQIFAGLDTPALDMRASLIAEARQIPHFLAGCAGIFGELGLVELAAEVDHPALFTAADALTALVAILDGHPALAHGTDATIRSRRA